MLLEHLSASMRQLVLRHASFGWPNNQRLEWLGDAVLGLVMAEQLYHEFPEAREGWLTRQRQNKVNRTILAAWAHSLEWQSHLVWFEQPADLAQASTTALADMLEACIGALLVEQGFDKTKQLVLASWNSQLSALQSHLNLPCSGKDAKTALQEWLQARGYALPIYQLKEEKAQGAIRFFKMSITLPHLKKSWSAEAKNKKTAEQLAAQQVWQELDHE